MVNGLRLLAQNGRYALVAGLVAGFALPGVAMAIKPWLAHLIVVLLFLTALRIGPKDASRGLRGVWKTARTVLLLQLALPLTVFAIAALLGVANSPYALALTLVFAAPALSGSPNLAILLGANPEPAFRLLIVGTALLPLTMLPVFWLLPQLGDLPSAILSSLRIFGAVGISVAIGLAVRAAFFQGNSKAQTEAMDGAMTCALVIIVVGLMAALRPALDVSPKSVLTWMAFAFLVNFGMQILTFKLSKGRVAPDERVPFSIVSGTRNVAIFLVTISPAAAEPLLLFLACYQVPMYLTPILARRFYQSG